ncbi:MAG: 2-C-methyl-D-erythritol 4-phosphate cytidylyltransferase [Marmoricola sp.]
MSARAAIVLLAAGSGRRVGARRNKVLLPLDGVAVLAHGVRTALAVDSAVRVVVVVRPEDHADVAAALRPVIGNHDVWVVEGGAERHDSEARALDALRADIGAGEIDVVAIHDGARPLASEGLFAAVIATAAAHGAAVPAVPAPGLAHLDGSRAPLGLVAVQTPQAFAARALLEAYDAAAAEGFTGTDTAACLERYSEVRVHAVDGEAGNLKVTFAEDLALAEELIVAGRPASG